MDGPKYLEPLVELIVFNLLIDFFNVPEKLLHKLSCWDKVITSFFVKQLWFPKFICLPVKTKVISCESRKVFETKIPRTFLLFATTDISRLPKLG